MILPFLLGIVWGLAAIYLDINLYTRTGLVFLAVLIVTQVMTLLHGQGLL